MTPIVILFWPAAGILLRRLVPAMLLDAGRERWARAAGPGPWPARLALFAAVLAPFASDGVWAPRLMLLAVGYAAGWDAIPPVRITLLGYFGQVSGKKAFIIEAFLFHQFAELVGGEA